MNRKSVRERLKLYAITDSKWLKNNNQDQRELNKDNSPKEGESLKDKVEEAILGGATMVQYREKKLKGEELKKEALEIKEVCTRYRIPLIINDDVMLARDIDADGVHVGQSDMEITKAREILGEGKIIGATAKTVEQAQTAYKAGSDYLGSGAVFGSTTKEDAVCMPKELLREISQSVPIPVAAIGGINEDNAGELKGLPIAGIAVIQGIFGRDNVRQGAADVRAALYSRPVIQCITNHVTVNDVANLILSMGASPIMAHHIMEAAEVQDSASGLLLNLGATDDYDAMKEAMRTAAAYDHPVVIDPVGVAVSSYRRDQLRGLLDIAPPSCIRGNYSEILALYNNCATLKGLDDDRVLYDTENDLEERKRIVSCCASRYNTIVTASGETDIISDGRSTVCVRSGHSMQRRITGSGCMLSAAIASVFALSPADRMALTEGVCRYMGNKAFAAAQSDVNKDDKENRPPCHPLSFKMRFMDSI